MKIFGIVGFKNCDKSALMKQLIQYFCDSGVSVSAIKHSHCDLTIDQPGMDAYDLRVSGCNETIVSSPYRWALTHEMVNGEKAPDIHTLLGHMQPVDLVLVEGFKEMNHEKLLVVADDDEFREENAELLMTACNNIQGVVTNKPLQKDYNVPVLAASETSKIASLIIDRCNLPVAV